MKQKTVKSAQKRIIKTGSGKILRRKITAQHLVMGKSKRARRLSGKRAKISSADLRKIKRLVPYMR